MWRERLRELSSHLTFTAAASEDTLRAAEHELRLELPRELRALLQESDGVLGEYELGLVWRTARILSDNRTFRTYAEFRPLYMPFDALLFFGDAGNGDPFAYAINDGEVRRNDIFVWDHENDSREWVAPSLEKYFEWWLAGRIKR